MKRPLFPLVLVIIITFCINSCNYIKIPDVQKGIVDIYLLESYKTVGNTEQIDESTVVSKPTPLLTYSDLLSYNSSKHTFKVTERAKRIIENQDYSVHGTAFALMVNDVLIYTGYFWPSYSSATCNWITIDPMIVSMNSELRVEIGYPGSFDGQQFPDKRNDSRILAVFESDNKLIK